MEDAIAEMTGGQSDVAPSPWVPAGADQPQIGRMQPPGPVTHMPNQVGLNQPTSPQQQPLGFQGLPPAIANPNAVQRAPVRSEPGILARFEHGMRGLVIKINYIGDRYQEGEFKATDHYKRRFWAEWSMFQQGVDARAGVGTPLNMWPQITWPIQQSLNAANIYCVEDLAQVPDSHLHHLGAEGRRLRDSAQQWLEGRQTIQDKRESDEMIAALKARAESAEAAAQQAAAEVEALRNLQAQSMTEGRLAPVTEASAPTVPLQGGAGPLDPGDAAGAEAPESVEDTIARELTGRVEAEEKAQEAAKPKRGGKSRQAAEAK